MATYYQTGTATDTQALMILIRTFLTAVLGWTHQQLNSAEKYNNLAGDQNLWYTDYYTVNGGYYALSTGIEGTTVDYRTYIKTMVLEGHNDTGSDPYYAYDDQPGYYRTAYTNDVAGPYTAYHFFGGQEGVDGNYFYCVLETEAGKFAHFGIGEVDRIGTLSARFAVCTYWDNSVSYWRSPGSAKHNRMFDGNGSTQAGYMGHINYHQTNPPPTVDQHRLGYPSEAWASGFGGWNTSLFEDSPNAYNGRTPLFPVHVYVDDKGSPTSWWRIVGMAPAHRFLNISNIAPGDIVNTDWKCFPVKAKNAATGATSGVYGWAYKFQ